MIERVFVRLHEKQILSIEIEAVVWIARIFERDATGTITGFFVPTVIKCYSRRRQQRGDRHFVILLAGLLVTRGEQTLRLDFSRVRPDDE